MEVVTGSRVEENRYHPRPKSFLDGTVKTGLCAFCTLLAGIGLIVGCVAAFGGWVDLKPHEQALLICRIENKTVDGPGRKRVSPMGSRCEVTIRERLLLESDEYLHLLDLTTGQLAVREGAASVFLGPYETVVRRGKKLLLTDDEYLLVKNKSSGEKRVVRGRAAYAPAPHDEVLNATRKDGVRTAYKLAPDEYVRVRTETTGALRVVKGPQAFVPGPLEAVQGSPAVQKAYQLRKHQYLKLVDTSTGEVRVAVGAALVFPNATEQPVLGGRAAAAAAGAASAAGATPGVMDAVNIDHDRAVRVLDRESGQQRLVTTKGRFFPRALEDILEVQTLIRVEPYEVAIVQDVAGAYAFHGRNAGRVAPDQLDAANATNASAALAAAGAGSAGSVAPLAKGAGAAAVTSRGTTFFLPPHAKLITMHWSSPTPASAADTPLAAAPAALKYKVAKTKIDLRSQYTFFTYTVRTSDNVELSLEGTLFWQVVDVPTLIATTQDPVYVVYHRCRSTLADAVSQVTLEKFMSGFGVLVNNASAADGGFFRAYGVQLNSLEVTSYTPRDAATATVLQQIIQETTNRINRLQKARSENEVTKEKLTAQVAQEQQRALLVRAKADNEKLTKLQAQLALSAVDEVKLATEIGLERNRSNLVAAKAGNDAAAAAADGEAQGVRLAKSMARFFGELAAVVPNASQRLALFQHLNEQDVQTKQLNVSTANLGQGNAHLFLAPEKMNLRLAVAAGGAAPVLDDDSGTYTVPPPPTPPPATPAPPPAPPAAPAEAASG